MTATDAPTLGQLDRHAFTGFRRGSAIRRITAEPILGLLLQRTLVMDVAHVKVGAGVTHHSLFQANPLGRAWSTLDLGLRMVWGDAEVARAAATQVYRFHDHVNGELPDANPAFAAGDAYTAHDASLLLWVWATLVDVAEVAHARWLRPLSSDDADAFYADMATFARFFGIPADMIPPDRTAFGADWAQAIDGDELVATPTSEAIAREVLWYRHWNVPAPLTRPLRVLSIGTLDPRIRERFGLELSAADQRLFDRLDALLVRTYRSRPAWLVQRMPELYIALRRPPIGLRR